MSGPADSDLPQDARADDVDGVDDVDDVEEADEAEREGEARRGRVAGGGTGRGRALGGVAAGRLRTPGSAPAVVPAAYACGAAVCGLAAVLGARGRTRWALWLLIAGLLVMALGDQFD